MAVRRLRAYQGVATRPETSERFRAAVVFAFAAPRSTYLEVVAVAGVDPGRARSRLDWRLSAHEMRGRLLVASTDESLHLRFDDATHPDPLERVAAWRDAFAASVDVAVAPDETEGFSAGTDFCPLGPALLGDARYTDHTVVRDRRTIARTGGEQVILDLFVEGGFAGTVGGRPCTAKAGDCFVMDMRGTFHLKLSRGRFIGFIMPRALFEDAAAGPAHLHGLVLPAGSPKAVLLGGVLTSLAEAGPGLSPPQAEAVGRVTIALVAACLTEAGTAAHRPRETRSASPRKADPSLVRLRRHIERHAADPAYDPDALARAFDLSRSALYRLFRPHGGVAAAIRRRRADLALRALSSGGGARRSLADVAAQTGWSDVRALRRALRALFDATPDELRGRRHDPVPGTGDAGLRIGTLFDEVSG